MTEIKVKLSESGIGSAIQQLKSYQSRLNALESELPSRLGESAAAFANAGSSASVSVSSVSTSSGAKVVATSGYAVHGPSRVNPDSYKVLYAALEEYGYGYTGTGTHPKADGWRYDVMGHGPDGWLYRDGGSLVRTSGEVGKRYMFNAAERIRTQVASTAKEILAR